MSRKNLDTYRDVHPVCEACGNPAPGGPHHIRTRGSGGGDTSENLLQLCGYCHQMIHVEGVGLFVFRNPHLEEKIFKALPYLKEELKSEKPFRL